MSHTSNQRRRPILNHNRSSSSDTWYRRMCSTMSPTRNTATSSRHCSSHANSSAVRTSMVAIPHGVAMSSTHTTPDSRITMKFSITTTRKTLTILILAGLAFFLMTSIQLMIHIHYLETPSMSSSSLSNYDRSRQLLSMFITTSSPLPLLLSTTASMSPPQNPAKESSKFYEPSFPKKTTTRTCTSPEKDVPWIFGTPSTSTCRYQHHANTTMMKIVQSRTSDRMCGYCMDDLTSNDQSEADLKTSRRELQFAKYLYDLSQQLRALKEKECSSLIVYGVAFGEQYTHWLTRQQADPTDDGRPPDENVPFKMSPEQVQQLLQRHGPCFMTFVLEEHVNQNMTRAYNDNENSDTSDNQPKYYYSNDGLQLLIPIQRKDLPYTNMRRNTKIFKMIGPSYLFGNWVQRVVWQDAKLIAYNVPNTILPHNYFDYFFNVIHMTSIPRNTNNDNHVCASFMGLPYHKNTMGRHAERPNANLKQTVQFRHHCDAIVEASNKRPTVSDDLHSLQYQCSTYNKQAALPPSSPSSLSWSTDMTSSLPPPETQYHSSALDDALIDSALIVWDLRSERCQNFVATISCTWLDEIHCYSDRDQVSFPYVFLQMGLQVIPTDIRMNYHNMNIHNNKSFDASQQQEQLQKIVTPETHHRLFAHYTSPLQPLVHIAKSSCHWYYNNLNDCDFTQNDPVMVSPKPRKKSYYLPKFLRPPRFLRKWIGYVPPNYKDPELRPVARLSTSPKVYKLAIVVTGSFHRFIFQSSMMRFIQPLTNQGHSVDYYLSLSMKKAPAYRSDQNYMNLLVNDPIFDRYINHNDDGTVLLDEALIKARIHMVVQQQLEIAGANLRYMTFQDNYSGMDSHPHVIERRKIAQQIYPNDDPDLRFPTFDIRDVSTMNRTANANRNMLNLFYHIQHVYKQVLAYEKDIRVPYDYVLFLRDDTMWLQNFDFRSLVEGDVTATTAEKHFVRTYANSHNMTILASSSNVELFIPSCDARVPSMHPAEINDHISVVKRERADVYGNYFDELFRTDMDTCARRLDDKIRFGRSIPRIKGSSVDEEPIPLRGCNSEMILKYILEQNNVTIQKVGQGKIPFQRMALVKNPETSKVHTCFHKYCQSQVDPLIIHPGIKKCKELTL